jgi:ubiquinone/menaquinone biosynthesis C-methylase UbiE
MFHPQGPTFYELAVQALSSTQRGYDLLAPKFDYTPFRTPQFIIDATAKVLAKRGTFRQGLDVCCGTGAGMEMLRPLCSERVVGIDFSRPMLDVCRKNTASAPGSSALEYVVGDALHMPFDGDTFDLAVCFGALGHFVGADEQRLIDEVARVLRPGGCFALVTTARPPFWSRANWLAQGFNAAMWARNLVIQPPFVMYYLTFLLPQVAHKLQKAGTSVEVAELFDERPLSPLKLVIGVKQ